MSLEAQYNKNIKLTIDHQNAPHLNHGRVTLIPKGHTGPNP